MKYSDGDGRKPAISDSLIVRFVGEVHNDPRFAENSRHVTAIRSAVLDLEGDAPERLACLTLKPKN